jgi:hypothetical protein
MYLFLENFPDFLISSWNIIKLVIPTIVAILFAYILHKSIEVPIIKAARKFLNIK